MNMKWFCSVGVVALLAACSEDQELVGYKTRSVDSLEELAEVACKSSNDGEQILVPQEDDPIFTCKSGVWKNGHDVVVGEKKSSSSAKSSSSTDDKSSSSAKSSSSSKRVVEDDDEDSEEVISKRSSSSKVTIDPEMSSSSIVINNEYSSASKGVLGSCAPVKPSIYKGETTAWKFVLSASNDYGVKITELMRGEFNWKFDGGAVVAGDEKKTITSSDVVYSKSGSYGASVKVSIGGIEESVMCTSLQVNGDPITGCECGTAATSVDYTATPDVAWTVTGCKSAADISYEWDGAAGTDSFTKMFDAATAGYAPKLKVKNSDNTAIDVTCPAVRATEGAEYVMKEYGSYGAIEFKGPTDAVILMDLPSEWHGLESVGTCTFTCDLRNVGNDFNLSGSVDGVKFSGQFITNAYIPLEHTMGGYSMPLSLAVDPEATVRCYVQW